MFPKRGCDPSHTDPNTGFGNMTQNARLVWAPHNLFCRKPVISASVSPVFFSVCQRLHRAQHAAPLLAPPSRRVLMSSPQMRDREGKNLMEAYLRAQVTAQTDQLKARTPRPRHGPGGGLVCWSRSGERKAVGTESLSPSVRGFSRFWALWTIRGRAGSGGGRAGRRQRRCQRNECMSPRTPPLSPLVEP